MKIRLSIDDGSGRPTIFEHLGPVIRIGRDLDCELSLQGEASTALSRQHARMDLSAAGAMVIDLGSSNGTRRNGQLLEGPAPLGVGDRIQMGYTGATLTVLALDLAPAPAPAAPRTRWIGALAAGTMAAVVVAALVLHRKPSAPEAPSTGLPPEVATAPGPAPAARPPLPVIPATDPPKQQPSATETVKPPAPAAVERPEGDPGNNGPSDMVKEVGSYVALEHWVSVLLQRQGETSPWVVLRREAKVSTATTLVSLPGYRSLIALNTDLDLILWGNLPEFDGFSVRESVVMLHAPASGVDLDFTLDRGRVHIANRKPSKGPAHVRLRFLREVWEMELPDDKSEVFLELIALPYLAPAGAPGQPAISLGLFPRGRVRVRTPRQELGLDDRARLWWASQEPATVHREPMEVLLPGLANPPDRQLPAVRNKLLTLIDWDNILGGSNAAPATRQARAREQTVAAAIKTEMKDVKDPSNQDVGILFLAALDEIDPLLSFLEYPSANVRGTTISALQSWLAWGGRHAREQLLRILVKQAYSRETAEQIIRLLHFYPEEALAEKQTYEKLVSFLDDRDEVVRMLAFWQLDQLASIWLPREARKIPPFDPSGKLENQRKVVEQWKKLIQEGKVPVRPQTR